MKVYELMQLLGAMPAAANVILTVDLPKDAIKQDEDGWLFARCNNFQCSHSAEGNAFVYATAAKQIVGFYDAPWQENEEDE